MSIRSIAAALRATVVATAFIAAAAPTRAELGGAPMQTPPGAALNANARVARAASLPQGTSGTPATPSYTVKETTLSSGTVVREYVGQGGTVFGVAWSGPAAPDLSALLGSYFPRYIDGIKALRAQGRGRGPIALKQSDLAVHVGGHMGMYFGQAYLPQSLPVGVSANDIR
jgi:Protein of unknown function (DUF2844)